MSGATIERDVVCRGCGYNLRSLAGDGVCPECAVPVGFSLLPDSLSLNGPGDFRMARIGVLLVIALCAYAILAYILQTLVNTRIGGEWVFARLDQIIFGSLPFIAIFVLQASALYLITAVVRTRMRGTLLALLLGYAFLLVRFAVGWAGRSSIVCQMNETVFEPIFVFLWLSAGVKISGNLGRGALEIVFRVLRWVLPAALISNLGPIFGDPMVFVWGRAISFEIAGLNLVVIAAFAGLFLQLQWSIAGASCFIEDFSRPSPLPSPGVPGEGERGGSALARAGILLEAAMLGVLLLGRGVIFGVAILERVIVHAGWLFGGSLTNSPFEIRPATLAGVEIGQVIAVWGITSGQVLGRYMANVVRSLAVMAGFFALIGFIQGESSGTAAGTLMLSLQIGYVMLFFLGCYLERYLPGQVSPFGPPVWAIKWILVIPLGFETVRDLVFFGSSIGRFDMEFYELLRVAQIVVQAWGIWVLFEVWRGFGAAKVK